MNKNISEEIKSHMRQNRTFKYIMLLLITLGLSACSSRDKAIEGKYISTFDNSLYYEFSKNYKYSTNVNNETWEIPDYSFSGTYEVIEDKITLLTDSSNEAVIELGYKYNNYIGSWWEGILSKTYENTTITYTLGDLILTYNFKEDKSYEYVVISNDEIVHIENGIYTINGNEVVCTSEDGVTITFIKTEDKVFCVEYVKE